MEKFEQSRLDLSKAINDLIEEKFYWKLRCQLAEDYIHKSPIDPDINAEQIIAYQYWQIEVQKQKTD
jgi:hypothetical protein